MATLNSPGVSVTVIDESFYTPAAAGTAPMIFVVTSQDKVNPSGTIAPGTTKANAGKVWLITSQRDLTDTFGTPLFYTDGSLNPLHGNELNEYGLQASYSALGISSRSYVVRADLNLSDLSPQPSAPTGEPVSGTYWLDVASTVFGVKEWNSTTQKFTNKTPIVLDSNATPESFNGTAPATSIGLQGDYCIVALNTEIVELFYKPTSNIWVRVQNTFDNGKLLQIGPHYNYPTWTGSTPNGSVWVTTTVPTGGANFTIKYYNGSTDTWVTIPAALYENAATATYNADKTGGGKNIPIGSLFVETNALDNSAETANFQIWRRQTKGETVVISDSVSSFASNGTTYSFNVQESRTNQATLSSAVTINMTVTNVTTYLGSLLPAAISAAGVNLQNITASFDTSTKVTTITHKNGGDIKLININTTTQTLLGLAPYTISASGDTIVTSGTENVYKNNTGTVASTLLLSNWKPLVFESSKTVPTTTPADGTLWYQNVIDQVDIMVNSGTTWVSYNTYYPAADPGGVIVKATEPINGDRSDGGNLVTGDIWVDTSDIEQYGKNIYCYDSTITSGSKWVKQNTTDQSSPTGWLFADARWATSGSATEPSTIRSLRTSNYVDPDVPDPALYPRGLKLWNTRRSGYNVKKYIVGHIDKTANSGLNIRFGNQSMASYAVDRWVSQFSTNEDGSGVFGRKAQRKTIVKSLKALVDTNVAIRDTDTLNFNLLAAPGYPELVSNLVGLNNERGITAFVIGDTPFRLTPNGTALNAYGNNLNSALETGEDGVVTNDEYLAMYYPSGYTTDNTGNNIVVPPSHMMLRTFINNDSKAYLWFAPAGIRRGTVDNATSVGYITAEGEFKTTTVPQNLRDVLDDVKINPISSLTGVGLVAYGQKTRAETTSALDRINVARLVAYLRRQLDVLSRPFLFEPNDAQTRREIKAAAESLLLELVGQRALYDYIVVCDETNNTPARIDRNELYMDIAVEPVKAVEFIYIPLRIKNTGDIQAGL